MLKAWLVGVIACVGTTALGAAVEPQPTVIRVLVADRVADPVVEVTGRYRVINPQTKRYLSIGWLGKTYPVHAQESGIRWGEEFPGVYQIAIQPASGRTSILVNGVQYRGTIVLYHLGDHISVVNEVPIDYYCKVILSPQASTPRPPEVLAAMAIVARTHACWQVVRHAGGHFDVRAEDVDYRGHAVTHDAGAMLAAVDNTRYMVLEQGACPGQAFPAVWNEDCAGKTAAYETVFRTTGVEGIGVEAPLASHHRQETEWEVSVPKRWLAKAAQLTDISRINLYTDSFSDKVYAMRLAHESEAADLEFAKLQEVVGADRLRSNDFTVRIEGSEVIFSGYGQGHGVGLCLYSAREMAGRGKNAAEILEAFFPQASLRIFEPERPKRLPLLQRFYPKQTAVAQAGK